MQDYLLEEFWSGGQRLSHWKLFSSKLNKQFSCYCSTTRLLQNYFSTFSTLLVLQLCHFHWLGHSEPISLISQQHTAIEMLVFLPGIQKAICIVSRPRKLPPAEETPPTNNMNNTYVNQQKFWILCKYIYRYQGNAAAGKVNMTAWLLNFLIKVHIPRRDSNQHEKQSFCQKLSCKW
jgi:hypothetical protein